VSPTARAARGAGRTPAAGVLRGQRLVQRDGTRLAAQGLNDRQALRLAARQLTARTVDQKAQIEGVDQRIRLGIEATSRGGKGDLLAHASRRQGAGALGHDGDGAAMSRQPVERHAVKIDDAVARLGAGHRVQNGRLAGARVAEQAKNLTVADGQVGGDGEVGAAHPKG
jgi:hypothetical protein